MTPSRKYTLCTGAFYAISLPLIPYFNNNDRSGPCSPNLDVLFPLFVAAVALFGFLVSILVRFLDGNKALKGPAIINGTFLCLFFLLGHFGLI